MPRGELDVPGQGIEIDGGPAFIFLYQEAETRADAAGVNADDVVPERWRTPTPEGERRMTQGSNVIVVVVGGSPEHGKRWKPRLRRFPERRR